MQVLCWKTVLVLARMLLGDYHRLQAILLLVASAMVVWNYARWPPYYRHQITHIQVGCWIWCLCHRTIPAALRLFGISYRQLMHHTMPALLQVGLSAMTCWAAVLLLAADWMADSRGAEQAWGSATRIMVAGLGPVGALAALLSWASYSIRTARPYERFRYEPALPAHPGLQTGTRPALQPPATANRPPAPARTVPCRLAPPGTRPRDIHRFADPAEVELAARCCARKTPDEEVADEEAVAVAGAIIRAGLQQFGGSARLAVLYSSYLIEVGGRLEWRWAVAPWCRSWSRG